MKHKRIPIAVALLFILAAAVAFYPLASNALAERNRSLVRTEYAEQIEQTDDAEIEAILAAAQEYIQGILIGLCAAALFAVVLFLTCHRKRGKHERH